MGVYGGLLELIGNYDAGYLRLLVLAGFVNELRMSECLVIRIMTLR